MVWAIMCGKSSLDNLNVYIMAHEEGHVAQLFGAEKQLIDKVLEAYPRVNRKVIEKESDEYRAVVAGLVPFAESVSEFIALKRTLVAKGLNNDRDFQKAVFLMQNGMRHGS